jgi:hypothetical protein
MVLGGAAIPLVHRERLTAWANAILAAAVCLLGAAVLLLILYY